MATNKINVTAVDFSTSGNIDNGSTTNVNNPGSLPTNWTRVGDPVYTNTCVLQLGFCNTFGVGYTDIYRCTDLVNFATWVTKTLPTTANWISGAYGAGKIVLIGQLTATNVAVTVYSTDGGDTWNAGSSFTASQLWGGITFGNGKFIIGLNGTTWKQSTDGINWTSLSVPGGSASTPGSIIFNSNIGKWMYINSASGVYLSTDATPSAWTDVSTNVGKTSSTFYIEKIFSTGNYFVASLRSDYPVNIKYVKMSTNGTTWNTISTHTDEGIASATSVFDFNNGTLLITNPQNSGKICSLVGTQFTYSVSSVTNFYGPTGNLGTNNTQTYPGPKTLLYGTTSYSFPCYTKPINIGKLSADRYIDVTASKTGATSVTKRLYIKQVQQTTPTYILYCNPGSFNLMSTLDGVVDPASFTNANATLIVTKDGIEQTGWTFTTTNDAGLTASISSNTLSITALTTSVDLAYANITASKTGESSLLLKIAVTKNKSGVISGINRGSSLSSIITNNNTALSIKFLNTGMVQIKYGTGSYGNLIPWFSPVNSVSPPGGSWWMNMTTTGDAFTTSAGSGWLALSTSREFIFDKTGSPAGTYTCNMTVQFGTTSTGGNISVSTGTLQIIIP